jgi:subtilisin family serine protease
MKKILGGELFLDGGVDVLVLANKDSMNLSFGSNTPAGPTTFPTFDVERLGLQGTAWDAGLNTQNFNFPLSGYSAPPTGTSLAGFAAIRGPTADGAPFQGVAFTALSELGLKASGDSFIPVERPLHPDVTSAKDAEIASQQDASLIHLTEFRADPRFAGIDGRGVSVVVIDTGIDRNHPFFGPDANSNGIADRIVFSFDFSGGNDSDASDFNGHGSNVASIVGSQDATYTGMAPGVNIIALKVFPDNSSSASTADISEAVNWVVANYATYNIVAVNMSLGQGDNLNTATNSSYHSSFATLNANNVAVVIASGNSFYNYQTQGVSSPSADPNAWSVGAVWDRDAGRWDWSSGAIDFTTGPDHIISFSQRSTTLSTIFAPGGAITGANQSGGTITESGTSQATPHIAGLVADMQQLALQVSGHLMSVANLRSTMVSSATNIVDGDDENDNVTNTGATFHRVDAEAWGIAILNLLYAGTAGVDRLNGTPADDVIHGQGSDDFLRGNRGNDTLFGDAGTDTAIFAGLYSAYTLTDLGGGSVRVSGPDGTDTLSSIELLQFDDKTINWPGPGSVSISDMSITEGNSGPTVANFTVTRSGGTAAFAANFATADNSATTADNDYAANVGTLNFGAGVNTQTISVTVNGDTKFETNETFFVNLSGATNGATFSDSQGIGIISNDDRYPSAPVHDFNGDFASDLLWRHNGGTFTEWQSSGNGFTPNVVVNATVNNSWHSEGAFDFSGDGRADLLWRNDASGQFTIWNSTGNGFTQNSFIGNGVDTSWSVAGLADFNGDGKSDMLWRNNNGAFTEWQSTGNSFTPNVVVVSSVDSSWHLVATADFSGDGKADLLWRNNSGAFTEWQSTGNGFTPNVVNVSSVDTTWHVLGVGDFNGDGKADLLWRNNNDAFTEWQSTGNGFTPNVFVNSTVDNSWHLAQVADFNADGKTDLLWRNDNGAFTEWQSTGNSFTPNVVVNGTVGTDWNLITHHYDLV